MRRILLLTIGLVASSITAERAEAQFLKRVKERLQQKVVERKMQTEENALTRATEPADSALAKVGSPVDSLTARMGGTAGAVVGRLGRGQDQSAEEDRLRAELAGGRAALPARFVPGTDGLDPASEPSLKALAMVMSTSSGAFLIQGRADPETEPENAPLLANARAGAIKTWLVTSGVPADRVFAAGDGVAMQEGPLASVVLMQ